MIGQFQLVACLVLAQWSTTYAADVLCPSSGYRNIRNPNDCTSYYSCNWGNPLKISCPQGLWFDATAQVCNWPDQSGCVIDRPPSVENSEDSVKTSCPTNWSVHKLLQHESNCSKFYSCSNGVPILMQCPAGLYFDYSIQVCNWPEQVKCTNHKPVVSPEESTTTPKSADENNAISSDEDKDVLVSLESQNGSGENNAISSDEDKDVLVSSESQNGSEEADANPCSASTSIMVPHQYDCTRYYFCTAGRPIELRCNIGNEFDPVSVSCVPISDKGCTAFK